MEQAGVSLIAQGSAAYLSDMKSATNATNTFVDATDKGSHRVSAAGQVIIGGLRQMGTMAVDAFAKAAKAGLDFAKDSIDLAADFEQTMNVLQATSEATAEEMAAVSRKAKELGSDLSLPATSAVDAGEAMLELSKAGFSVQESMDAAKGTLQLAAAAQIEEAKAAEISSNAINAFGLAAKDALFVSDLLAASANASSVEITDVAQSYQMAGAIFANFQGPVVGSKEAIVDLTTAVGILGNAGIKGSDAGTSLKQALLQLTGPSDKAKGLMKALAEDIGVAGDIAYDAQGRMRSFPEILDITARATKSLTDEKRNQYITDIFGADASRAVLVLMKQGPAAWAEMEKAVTRQGAAAELAAAKTQGYKGAIEGAKSQVETLQLTLAAGLLPVLADLINTHITPGIAKITDFVTPIAEATDPVLAFAQSLGGLSPERSNIAFYLVDVARHGEDLGGWLETTPALFQTLVGGVQDTIKEFSRLSDSFSTGGISGVIDQLSADIGAALPGIEAKLEEWGVALGAWILDALPDVLGNFAEMRGKMMAWVAESLPEWGDKLVAFAEPAAAWVIDAIPDLLNNLGNFAKQMIDQTLTYLPRWGATLVEFGVKAVSWIGEQLPALGGELGKFYNGMANWVVDSLPKWGSELATFGEKSIGWILDALPGLGTNLGKFAGSMLAWILQTTIDVTPKLAEMGLKFVGWVATDVIPKLPGALLSIATGLYNFISEVSKEVVPKLATMAIAFTGWVATDVLPKLPGVMEDIKSSIDTWIADTARWVLDQTVKIGTQLVAGIREGVSNAWDSFVSWLVDKAGDAIDAVLEAYGIKSPATEWMPIGQFAIEGIMAGMSETWPALTSLIGSLSKDLIDEMQDIGSQINGIIADSFGATASIDRQIAKNLDKFKDILPQYQQYTQGALKEAEQQARAFADPAEGAKFFKMRSDQILEYAKLQQDLAKAETASDRERIEAQMLLINAAQSAELAQFNATPRSDPKRDIASQINEIIAALADPKLKLTDEQLHYVDMLSAMLDRLGGVPHLAAGGVAHAGQPHWVGEDGPELFWPGVTGMVSPAASSQQMAARGPVYNGQVGNTYNNTMPIYTNNSPAALQQSWAVMQASMT